MPSDFVARWLCQLAPTSRLVVILTGAILIHLSLGTYHTFGNMLPYMASYMRNHTDPTVTIESLMWVPTFQGCFPFAMIIGGFLSNRIGPRLAATIGCYMMSTGVLLTAFTIKWSYNAFLFTYGCMFGLGQGIAYVVVVASVINWCPEKVGMVSGIVAAGFGFSSAIFAPLQTALINPKNYVASSEGYFNQPDLLNRVPHVFTLLGVVYMIMQGIGLVVICDPPADERKQLAGNENENDDSDTEDLIANTQTTSLPPREALKSSTFYWLFIALFCCSFYGNLFYNLYKTFGETFIEDDFFFAFALSLGTIVNAAARISWGVLTDRTSFQVALSSASLLATFLLLTMPITAVVGKYMYLVWLVLMFVCLAATHTLFITAAVRCFGSKYKTTNYGCLIVSTTLSGIVLAVSTQSFLQVIGYKWLFIIAAAFPFTAFLLTASIKVTPQGHLII